MVNVAGLVSPGLCAYYYDTGAETPPDEVGGGGGREGGSSNLAMARGRVQEGDVPPPAQKLITN